jgi:hypothetical protein
MILLAMASSMINTKFDGKVTPGKTYITNIHLPKNLIITGMPAIISIDKINNCKVIVEKCAPYEVTIETKSWEYWRLKKKL